jgi:hypothetical protein
MAYGAFDRPVRVSSRIGREAFEIEVHNAGKPDSGRADRRACSSR